MPCKRNVVGERRTLRSHVRKVVGQHQPKERAFRDPLERLPPYLVPVVVDGNEVSMDRSSGDPVEVEDVVLDGCLGYDSLIRAE